MSRPDNIPCTDENTVCAHKNDWDKRAILLLELNLCHISGGTQEKIIDDLGHEEVDSEIVYVKEPELSDTKAEIPGEQYKTFAFDYISP